MPTTSAAAAATSARDSPISSGHLTSLSRNVWFQRFVYTLQTFAVPIAYYFRPLCTAIAFFWLVYRAAQVLRKPLHELSFLLGFDVPITPRIDLASIKADGAIIHWALPEKPRTKKDHRYTVHLNGDAIGSVSVYESAVTVFGLQPNAHYIVRVALVNSQDFAAQSLPIRFCTKPAASGDYFEPEDAVDPDADGVLQNLPHIRPYRGLKDIAPASPDGAPMAREGSTGLAPRRMTGRRLSPINLGLADKHDPQPDDSEAPEGAETIQQLTERLDALRREHDEAERQAKDEEEEELRQKEDLVKERDELRAEANEKEKASRNLKKEVNAMERSNTQAQNERMKLERQLLQKTQERQKMKDDVERWEREAVTLKEDTERIRQQKEQHLQRAAQEKESLRAQLAQETAEVKMLDDEVKEKTSEIKKLERALKNSSPDGSSTTTEPNLVQQLQIEAEEDRQFQVHKTNMQLQYAMAYTKLEAAQRFYSEQMRYIDTLRAERRRQDESNQYPSPSTVPERLPRRGDSQRSRQAPSRHSASDSPRLSAFPPVSQSPFTSNIHPVASAFNNQLPFLNMNNGMTLARPTDEAGLSDEERERLTGGALMSPGAGADLLPADLFSGDGDNRKELVTPLPGLGSLPGLPGLPTSNAMQPMQDFSGAGPASPGSASSRSPSVFASPQASQHNLHIGSPEGVMDADRRSIRSTRSNRAPSGGTSSRFSGMFGIKQRTKNLENGPPLSKASSMPRADQGILGLDAATRKRTSSISGTVFQSPIDGLDGASESPSAAPPGRKAFGLFSKRDGGWPSSFAQFGRRPTSPRPGSTHSNELPRPSFDSSRWGVDAFSSGDATGGARNSPLAFGAGWNLPTSQPPRLYGSRHPSRRPSVQYGASGPPEDIMEDDDSDALSADHAPNLAPIGTKPPPGSKKATSTADAASAKLNPNAKNFTSFFRFGGKSSSSKDSDATTPIGTPTSLSAFPGAENDDDSPPASRKSRDTRSMTTTESSLLESGRTSSDLARTPSYSAQSDGTYPSPSLAGSSKETFMQKITRKSSSGKFTLPTFKREKSKMESNMTPTSAPLVPSEADEDESGELSASLSSLRESRELGRAGARSWSSALKFGKRKESTVGGGDETAEESGGEE